MRRTGKVGVDTPCRTANQGGGLEVGHTEPAHLLMENPGPRRNTVRYQTPNRRSILPWYFLDFNSSRPKGSRNICYNEAAVSQFTHVCHFFASSVAHIPAHDEHARYAILPPATVTTAEFAKPTSHCFVTIVCILCQYNEPEAIKRNRIRPHTQLS